MTTEKKYGSAELAKEYGPLTFGRALWSHRKCEEISQKDFAKMLGISASSLCDLEKGRKLPSVNRAAKIAKILNEPEKIWIRLALQDMLREADLRYEVSVA
ncbi:helix-turn-helix transcriptional regulator [uncultured Desulfobacter sp.]|uniref:helix-turn-helix transcriptional regulator n=1 Tax=uncultured Desulfobacter sp. TaxID=240139 RepID=UPI0029C8C090|nr:helix-turn-helix transcriptional regulator [uncultured Desulfobacter sp.]